MCICFPPGPDLALLQAAALVPAQAPQAVPAHLVRAALVLRALVPPPPLAPQAPPAPAAGAMTTADAPAQRKSLKQYLLRSVVSCLIVILTGVLFVILQI